MANHNNLTLIGRLGSDPEPRVTQSGFQIVKLNIAVNEKVGEEEKTTWFKGVAFKGRAEYILSNCTKGTQIYVEGPFRCSKYDDRDFWEMMINKVIVLDGKKAPNE